MQLTPIAANQTEIETKLIGSLIKLLKETKLEPVRHTEKTAYLKENSEL